MFVQCSNNDNYGSNNVQTSNLLPPLSRPLNGNDSIYSSTLTLSRSGKVPPPPPVRRTSSISDPNAITLGTLRRAGVSTYEEIKTLKRNLERSNSNLYEELVPRKDLAPRNGHVNWRNLMSTSLISLADPIYSSLNSSSQSPAHANRLPSNNPFITNSPTCDYSNSLGTGNNGNVNYSTQAHNNNQPIIPRKSVLQMAHDVDESLPPPPPEAYSDTENHYQSGHKSITNLRKEFLQTLNEKLSNPNNQRLSPKLVKRRSASLSNSDQEWDYDSSSTLATNTQTKPNISTPSHTESLAHSLVKRLSGHGSSSNSSSSSSSSTSASAASFLFRRHKNGDSISNTNNTTNNNNSYNNNNNNNSKNISHQPILGDGSNSLEQENGSILSRRLINPSKQVSQVARAAASEAIRRNKSLSESSIGSNESINKHNPFGEYAYYGETYRLKQPAINSDNDKHWNHNNNNNNNNSVNQHYYQSCNSSPNNYPRRSSQPAMGVTLSTNRQQIYFHHSPHKDIYNAIKNENRSSSPSPSRTSRGSIYDTNNANGKNYQFIRHNSFPNEQSGPLKIGEPLYFDNERSNTIQGKINFGEQQSQQSARENNDNHRRNANYSHDYNYNNSNSDHQYSSKTSTSRSITGAIESAIAARVNNTWLARRASQSDSKPCGESLFDQIRRGKELRKVARPE